MREKGSGDEGCASATLREILRENKLDIHFTTDVADDVERSAIDSVLGAPVTGLDDPTRMAQSGRYTEGSRVTGNHRDMLLPTLHAVHSAAGWISPGALNYICSRLSIPPAEAYGVASFYAMFSLHEPFNTVVHVCDDIACMTQRAESLCDQLAAEFGKEGTPGTTTRNAWKRSPCLGLCENAPAALCQNRGRADYSVGNCDASDLLKILRGSDGSPRIPGDSAPKHKAVKSGLLARVGSVDPCDLDAYRASGGYTALRRALDLGPNGIIREVKDAGLTGRGGAAFPTAVKWRAVVEAPARPHYLVCNADESEPGTFKDRVLMEEGSVCRC